LNNVAFDRDVPTDSSGTNGYRTGARVAGESSLTAAVCRSIDLMRAWHDMHPLPAAVVFFISHNVRQPAKSVAARTSDSEIPRH